VNRAAIGKANWPLRRRSVCCGYNWGKDNDEASCEVEASVEPCV